MRGHWLRRWEQENPEKAKQGYASLIELIVSKKLVLVRYVILINVKLADRIYQQDIRSQETTQSSVGALQTTRKIRKNYFAVPQVGGPRENNFVVHLYWIFRINAI